MGRRDETGSGLDQLSDPPAAERVGSEPANPAPQLRRRYLLSLGLVALLILSGALVIRGLVGLLATDAPAINAAGRQRMLSQRLAKDALRIRYATSQQTRARSVPQLRETLTAWAQGHARLWSEVDGPAAVFSGPELRESLLRVDQASRTVHDGGRELLAAFDAPSATPRDRKTVERAVDRILDGEPSYLVEMDRLVGLYEQKAAARVARLQRTGLLLLLSGLLVLALAALFVLEPSVRLIRRQFLESRRLNRFIQDVFGRYVTAEVMHHLLDTPQGLNLGGEEHEVTLLMADLRGFSALVDELAPQQSVRLLNHYLESMTTVIMEHQGTINEFLGDCIFAMFGAPFSAGNEVRRAAACAISMQLAMERVNQTFREEGLPSLEIGIAVHTGTVVAGNVGCERRAKYGVVGTAVNLTSRLEACARGGQVLISETALEQLGHEAALGPRFQVSVKGFRGALNACELIGLKGGPRIASVLSEEPAVWLRAPLPIRYRRVMGKQLGRVFGGAIVSVSPEQAEIRPTVPDSCPQCSAGSESSRAVVPLEPQDDVEVLLGEMHPWDSSLAVYAKATEVLGGENPGFRAVFTRIPPGARVLIDELVEQR